MLPEKWLLNNFTENKTVAFSEKIGRDPVNMLFST
jgi:hypothetical protein